MKYDITKLQKFSTYARTHLKSARWVYDMEKKGLIETVEIDTVKFVLVD